MKRALMGALLVAATLGLGGCYYDPGYSYVRSNGYSGDAYYGSGSTVVYRDSYPGYYYGSGYYGYGYGCCYTPGVVVGGVWYRDNYRGRNWNRSGPNRVWRGNDGHAPRPGYNGPRGGNAGPRPNYGGQRQGQSGPRPGAGPRSDAHRQNSPRNNDRRSRILEQ